MFLKPKNPKPVCLHERINRPIHQIEVDDVVTLPDGTTQIERKTLSPAPAPFPDLGDADCYGIMYQQMRGIELSPVDGGSRVSPMEAINIANKAIDNLHISEHEN